MGKNKKEKDNKLLTKEELISLISIYLSEWEHRDDVLWRQVFKFYYITLIVTVFPHITEYFDADFEMNNPTIFYYIGLIMSIMFYYVAVATAMRSKASYKAYEKVANLLDDEDHTYTRISVSSLKFGRIFKFSLAVGIITVMFFSLVIIAILLLVNNYLLILSINIYRQLFSPRISSYFSHSIYSIFAQF